MSESKRYRELREVVGRFFHRELERRYHRSYLANIDELRETGLLDAVPQEQIDNVKEFFKRVMYPVGPAREERDRGVETVEKLLKSTSSLISILPQIPGILLRHGLHLPAITGAGLHVVAAYQRARQLERKVLQRLLELIDEEDGSRLEVDEDTLRRAYAVLTRDETGTMLEETERIVRLGMDESLMRSTIDIVERVRESRDSREEQDALGYVLSVLEEVRNLSDAYSRRQIQKLLHLSEIIEAHYFDRLRVEYRERKP